MPEERIQIVLADDHKSVLQGLEQLLQRTPGFAIFATVSDGQALIEHTAEAQRDIAVTDVSMPGSGPGGIVEALETRAPGTRRLALSMHLDAARARDLLKPGLHGYVIQEDAFDELATPIRAAHNDDQFRSRAIVAQADPAHELTQQELECLAGSARGLTAKVIARELDISERAVRFHTASVRRKLSVQRATEALDSALGKGIMRL